jgi:hypothetical protein
MLLLKENQRQEKFQKHIKVVKMDQKESKSGRWMLAYQLKAIVHVHPRLHIRKFLHQLKWNPTLISRKMPSIDSALLALWTMAASVAWLPLFPLLLRHSWFRL